MMRHLSANLWLLVLTLLLCSVAYPLVLLAVAQLPFLKEKADGSLLFELDANGKIKLDADGKPRIIGSKLEAQEFQGDEYFWPRPSAVSYKGEASGASNLSANNPDLRRQVENRFGAVLKFKPKNSSRGEMIWPDIDRWFAARTYVKAEFIGKKNALHLRLHFYKSKVGLKYENAEDAADLQRPEKDQVHTLHAPGFIKMLILRHLKAKFGNDEAPEFDLSGEGASREGRYSVMIFVVKSVVVSRLTVQQEVKVLAALENAVALELLAEWARENPDLAKGWVKDNQLNTDYVNMWKEEERGKAWLKDKTTAGTESLKAEALAVQFLEFFSHNYPGRWPVISEVLETDPQTGANIRKLLPKFDGEPSRQIRTNIYSMWHADHPNGDLDPVPADMVTTSGSGLDPHITLKSALYQFDRVAKKWTELRKPMPRDEVARRLHKLLEAHKHAPLGGLAGVDLVNVLELNAVLKKGDW